MQIWDKLKKTDPKYTKPFGKFGKELTTVDPQYQIQMMTSMFGPVGKGWKYIVQYKYLDGLVFAEVSIKYYLDSKWYEYGPVCSVQNLSKKNGGLDDEAPKKAMTDAMTKAFSHLGMSADVFLGMFDDSKYVESLKKEFAQKIPKTNGKKNIKIDMDNLNMGLIQDDIEKINDIYALRKWKKENLDLFDSNNKSLREYRHINNLYENRKTKLNQGVITNG